MNAKTLTWEMVEELCRIEHDQVNDDKYRRNIRMDRFFATKSNRKMVVGLRIVETWWDNRSKNWITQTTIASTGFDIPDVPADYTGNKSDAACSHVWAVQAAVKAALNMEGTT